MEEHAYTHRDEGGRYFLSLVHYLYVCNNMCWANHKAGVWNSTWVSHVRDRDPNAGVITALLGCARRNWNKART